MKNLLHRQKYILIQLGFQSTLLYIYNKQKNMKTIFAVVASTLIWYGIISFITFNAHIDTWHWTARASFVVLALLTWDKVNKNI